MVIGEELHDALSARVTLIHGTTLGGLTIVIVLSKPSRELQSSESDDSLPLIPLEGLDDQDHARQGIHQADASGELRLEPGHPEGCLPGSGLGPVSADLAWHGLHEDAWC